MLEDISDVSQSHQSINMREARYKIYDRIKQRKVECKGELLSTRKWEKVYKKYLRLLLMNFQKH